MLCKYSGMANILNSYGVTMQYKTHEEFFETLGGDALSSVHVTEHPGTVRIETGQGFTVEELYQHFKARMLDEIIDDTIKAVLEAKEG